MNIIRLAFLQTRKWGDYVTTVHLTDVHMQYDGTKVLDNFTYTFEAGKFYTILGPSGCGKTTVLKLIGGFIHPTDGEVYFNDKKMNGIDANVRKVNTVFQDYALFPHLNVYENIAFGLRIKKTNKQTIEQKVARALKLVNLENFKTRDIQALSGGQRQRVAIARAIVNEPSILLLDEPLSALDQNLRIDMQYELKEIQRELGITFIFVTHDQEESLALSDEILVMDKGKIVQTGTPKDIYDEPLNRYVADFIGESNIVEGTMPEDGVVKIYGKSYECVDGGFAPNAKVDVMLRPEDIVIKPHNQGKINVDVDTVLFRGVHYEISVYDNDGYEWIVHSTVAPTEGQPYSLDFKPEDIHIMLPGEDEASFDKRIEQYEEQLS